jgi:hypothetical protein
VFYAGAGLTVLSGAATIAFGLDANGKHDDFEKAGCNRGGSPVSSCMGLKNDGTGAETAANVFLVSTVVLGAATAVVGLFFTDWHHGKSKDQPAAKVRFSPPARDRAPSFPVITFW